MRIGIITAMPEESAAILKNANNIRRSKLGEKKLFNFNISGNSAVMIETGMGMLNAGWGSTTLAGEGIDLLISAGFGGAVRQGLHVGDIVMARYIVQLHGNDLEEVSVGFYGHNNIADKLSLPLGTFISCDIILKKRELADAMPADCANPVVEIETAAIARVAAQNRIPFLALRTISDPWDEELDFSIDEFCDDSMQIRIPKVLRTIAQRPHIIPQLIRLARNSRTAAKALSKTIGRLLQHI